MRLEKSANGCEVVRSHDPRSRRGRPTCHSFFSELVHALLREPVKAARSERRTALTQSTVTTLVGVAEMACGSEESKSPFPVSPKGQAGAGRFPPRRKHAARQQKALARIDAAGSPHKRAAAPLCIPCVHCSAGLDNLYDTRNELRKQRRTAIVYTKYLTLPSSGPPPPSTSSSVRTPSCEPSRRSTRVTTRRRSSCVTSWRRGTRS